MGQLTETSVRLRIRSDLLEPETVTAKLDITPDISLRKGQLERVSRTTGKEILALTGLWLIDSGHKAATLEQKILHLVSNLEGKEKVWLEVIEGHQADLFCGIFLNDANEGTHISPSTLKLLADLNIALDFDIYSRFDE